MTTSAPQRLVSHDVLRGLTVAGIFFVNTQSSEAHHLAVPPVAMLEHAPWAGLTVADLVFPAFPMILGVSIVLAQGGQQQAGRAQP